MIVSCPNCNKKFNIDEKLIPEKGRLLQCSSCNHKWHYTIQKKNDEIVENIDLPKISINKSDDKDKKIFISPSSTEKKNNIQKIDKKINKNKRIVTRNKSKTQNISLANIFNNLVIIIISFIALIIILDTFKNNISSYLPILIPLLDNLYLSIFDLISFVKDLFN
tara:strand:+ start:1139 stop:1633 length:495 start_codon:yes stop_codon:yes gene_type:complete